MLNRQQWLEIPGFDVIAFDIGLPPAVCLYSGIPGLFVLDGRSRQGVSVFVPDLGGSVADGCRHVEQMLQTFSAKYKHSHNTDYCIIFYVYSFNRIEFSFSFVRNGSSLFFAVQ